jgi:GAF domain-containing protein
MNAQSTTAPPAGSKSERYARLAQEIDAVLAAETNQVARLATVAAMLAAAFEAFSWTGFYLVDPGRPDELVIGPYQGSLGCLRIAPGRGVCGAAAARRETLIVPDVEAFEGHIACDPRTRSEIVVPVFDAARAMIGVLDVDSAQLDAFDADDARGLEAIVRQIFAA